MHVPEQCRGGGRVQKRGAKRGGGDVSQKKGDGEARENDLESFHSFRRVTKSAVGTSPKSATSLTRDSTASATSATSHSSPPTSSDYFPRRMVRFYFFSSFLLTVPFSHRCTGAPSRANVSGASRARCPCTWFVFLPFFSLLTAPFPHRCTGTPFRSQTLGGLPSLESVRAAPFRS